MPKINYEKQPFRVCRWNRKSHDNKPNHNKLEDYFCDHGEEYVNEDKCMKCFCNTWFNVCSTCGKLILKTDLIHVFLPEYRMGYICNTCYDGEELVKTEQIEKEVIIFHDIK